jgi:hypothetical protein
MIQNNKQLTKSEMGFQIGAIEPYNCFALYWDFYKREEIVSEFNKMFGTKII